MRKKRKLFSIIKYLISVSFLPFWYLQRLIPRDKKMMIFGAWFGNKYSDNSKYVYEYVLAHHREIKAVWITRNRAIYDELKADGKPVCLAMSLAGWLRCLRAGFSVSTCGNGDVNDYCLNGCVNIWLWHGMPLKKILYDDDFGNGVGKQNGAKKPVSYRYPWNVWNINKTLTSGRFFLPFLSSAFRLGEQDILTTGLPRCDGLFAPRSEPLIEKTRATYHGCKILLYMPTHRVASYTGIPFDPFNGYGFSPSMFQKALNETNTVFLYKPHFYDAGLSVSISTARFIQIGDNDYDDLYNLLALVDMLMTDYSSVYFDFIATRKPVILAPFDYDDYIKNSREHYFDYWKEMEGVKAGDWEEVLEILAMQKYYAVGETAVKNSRSLTTGRVVRRCLRLFCGGNEKRVYKTR